MMVQNKILQIQSTCTQKDFAAEIQGRTQDVHEDYFEDINIAQYLSAFVHESNFGYASALIIRVGEDLEKQLKKLSHLYKITERTVVT